MVQVAFRPMQDSSDCQMISRAFNSQGWNKPVLLYEIKWSSCYQSFLQNGVPEISDLNVLKRYQRNGIGSALVFEAERRVSKRAVAAGIGVGLTPDYGPASRLYRKLGFKPDGLGLTYNNERCKYGSQVRVDDDLVLWLSKSV